MQDPEAAVPPLEQPEAEIRRSEALRAAGAAYLEASIKAVGSSSDGHITDQFSPVPAPKPRKKRKEKVDPDIVAFGQLFESAKTYLYATLFIAASAASPVLIKGSLYTMQTPAVLLFLHMLATSLMLWLAAWFEVFPLQPLSLQAVKGAGIRSALGAMQKLCIFSTLHHNSVNFVLCWTLAGRELLELAAAVLAQGGQLPPSFLTTRPLYVAAAVATALEFVLDQDKVWVGGLMMVLWTVAATLELVWQTLKGDPHAGGHITSFWLASWFRDCSAEEDALEPPTLTLLSHSLPAVPVLLLGFLALEGRELVDHELSVPAVKVMLLAIAAYVTAEGCKLMLQERMALSTQLGLRAAATLVTIIAYFLEEVWTISWAAVLCTLVACASAHRLSHMRGPA